MDFGPVTYIASNTTGNTFTFNPDYQSQSNAEASCQKQGAHLAVYGSEAEQAEVAKWAASRKRSAADVVL
jgi:hypothetical protein